MLTTFNVHIIALCYIYLISYKLMVGLWLVRIFYSNASIIDHFGDCRYFMLSLFKFSLKYVVLFLILF